MAPRRRELSSPGASGSARKGAAGEPPSPRILDDGVTVQALLVSLILLGWPLPAAAAAVFAPVQIPSLPDTTFRHSVHRSVGCLECHRMAPSHGVRLVRNVSDCRACHHTRERANADCVECHVTRDLGEVVFPMTRAFDLSVKDAPEQREIDFRHVAHSARACSECHARGPTFDVPDLDCSTCHDAHHAATSSGCWSCHREPREGAHTSEVHVTCSGAGCHQDPPFDAPPPSRTGCLWCHADKVDHEPQGTCSDCHVLSGPGRGHPPARPARDRGGRSPTSAQEIGGLFDVPARHTLSLGRREP